VPYWLKKKLFDFKTGAINSTRETCQKRFCEFYGQCFINRLKIATREANVVVANHSLVFSDPWDNYEAFSILPHNFKVLVIDEAINIEDAATNASTATFARNAFLRLLSDFFGKKSSRKKGVLKRIESYVETFGDSDLSERARKLRQSGVLLAEDANALFAPIAFALRKRALEYDDREEIFPQFLEESETALQNIASRLRETIAFLDACLAQYCRKERNGICNEIKIFQDEFRDYYNFIAVLKELNKNKYIFYRIASADLEDFSLNFCHKDVGRYLEENLYGKGLRSIVFTSATLTYEKSFDFVRRMWGLDLIPEERIVYERLPYLFDYGSQAALALVSDLPPRSRVSAEENDQKHYPESADFIKNILLANNGAALMLFNSKKDALKFGELLVDDLEENNIPLYSAVKSADPRIMSGGRTGIIEEFKAYPESCLLGTAGFREGVNVPGSALELVFIVQLPFSVPTDPIKNNRKLAYGGFSGYVIPHCIFSIKQAFGRLIRTKDDSGLVFILDARVLSYAEKIGKNLPDGLRIFHLNAPGYAGFNKRLASTKGKKNRVLKILGDGGG
jgi:ATP-dependent DNA helicase DinG